MNVCQIEITLKFKENMLKVGYLIFKRPAYKFQIYSDHLSHKILRNLLLITNYLFKWKRTIQLFFSWNYCRSHGHILLYKLPYRQGILDSYWIKGESVTNRKMWWSHIMKFCTSMMWISSTGDLITFSPIIFLDNVDKRILQAHLWNSDNTNKIKYVKQAKKSLT